MKTWLGMAGPILPPFYCLLEFYHRNLEEVGALLAYMLAYMGLFQRRMLVFWPGWGWDWGAGRGREAWPGWRLVGPGRMAPSPLTGVGVVTSACVGRWALFHQFSRGRSLGGGGGGGTGWRHI